VGKFHLVSTVPSLRDHAFKFNITHLQAKILVQLTGVMFLDDEGALRAMVLLAHKCLSLDDARLQSKSNRVTSLVQKHRIFTAVPTEPKKPGQIYFLGFLGWFRGAAIDGLLPQLTQLEGSEVTRRIRHFMDRPELRPQGQCHPRQPPA
jgi:hypothetical protein